MDSLYFLIKSQSFGESPNLFNMISDFTSEPLSETSKSHRPYLWSRSKCWMRAHKRTFNAQRLKSQIWTMGFRCFVSFANSTNQNFSIFSLCRNSMEVTVPMLPAMPLDLPYKHPQSWFFPLLRLLLPFWLQVQRFRQS